MGYHLRIESRAKASFVTARTMNSELWFANNVKVEELALARLAKYADKYRVCLNAFALEGSHYHQVARFPGETLPVTLTLRLPVVLID
jgi:hypothetical protein